MENKNSIQLEIYTGIYVPKITQYLEQLGTRIAQAEDSKTAKATIDNVDLVYTLLERIVQESPLDERRILRAMHPELHPKQHTPEDKSPFVVSLNPESNYAYFGEALLYMRKQVPRLSQARLANKADLSSRTIHRTEIGFAPRRRTIEQLLEVLAVKEEHTPQLHQLRLGTNSEKTIGELLGDSP